MKINVLPRQVYRDLVQSADPRISCTDTAFAAAAILLAAVKTRSTDVDVIAKEVGYPRPLVVHFARNFQSGGVFSGEKIRVDDWTDSSTGRIAFWADVLCGEGTLEKTYDKHDRCLKKAYYGRRAET
jgi:hypothetical protein